MQASSELYGRCVTSKRCIGVDSLNFMQQQEASVAV